jgi:competence ComEA-like helix-hairpin-helix protein
MPSVWARNPEMRVLEGQRLGSLALLTVSLAFYGVSLFNARQPVREAAIPWGSQGPGLMAVEVMGGPGREGIYFLPVGVTIGKMREIAVIPETEGQVRIEGARISAGSLVTSGQGEVKIGEMAAAKRLALGLPVDVNHASEEDLSLIPGIGGKIAYQIVQLRKQKGAFRDLSDLMTVPGIKEKKLNDLRLYLIAGQTRGPI